LNRPSTIREGAETSPDQADKRLMVTFGVEAANATRRLAAHQSVTPSIAVSPGAERPRAPLPPPAPAAGRSVTRSYDDRKDPGDRHGQHRVDLATGRLGTYRRPWTNWLGRQRHAT
jgi:hypothetical protein